MLFSEKPIREPSTVVVTGAGIITPYGSGWKKNAAEFQMGTPLCGPVTLFDVSKNRVKHAAEISENELSGDSIPRAIQRLDRAARMLFIATRQASHQGGMVPGTSIPMIMGTTSGGMVLGEDYFRQALAMPLRGAGQSRRVLNYQAQTQVQKVADEIGLTGPVIVIANACASGADAIGAAWQWVRQGHATRVLTGGYDALSQLVFTGFDSLQALSPTRCRPFDQNRDGLMLGEGAAVVHLESLESATTRGTQILGEIAGYGTAYDTHHITQPHPSGAAALQAMTRALQSGNISAGDIDYINAHGTATPLNDSAEAAAINRLKDAPDKRFKVSSTKAGIGHLLGAAGAVEAVVSLMAMQEQWLPPTTTLETLDPSCDFELVSKPQPGRVNVVLSNSFGFGGSNASLLFRRFT